jgi:8-oxo-dGTP pyrophosphatase MutT (NUDIX family)
MNRHTLLSQLNNYQPSAPEEQAYKKRMISFLQAYPDCFKRTLEIGHFTASAWLLNKDHSQALLMHHRKLDMWVQLGGHCDGNENILEVALKEAQEESGIDDIEAVSTDIFDIDIHLIPANSKEKEHYHYDVRFLLHVTGNQDIIQNHESKALRWFSKDQDLPTKERSVIRMAEKWKRLTL